MPPLPLRKCQRVKLNLGISDCLRKVMDNKTWIGFLDPLIFGLVINGTVGDGLMQPAQDALLCVSRQLVVDSVVSTGYATAVELREFDDDELHVGKVLKFFMCRLVDATECLANRSLFSLFTNVMT
jgi:hypothetical protein